MSLPPFKHTRNPTMETEEEFRDYVASTIPLITHNGVVEKRKTANVKLVRSEPPHTGIEFEYLPIFPSAESIAEKRNISHVTAKKINSSVREKSINKNPSSVKADNVDVNVNADEETIDETINEDEETKDKIIEMKNEPSEIVSSESNELAKSTRDSSLSSKSYKGSVKKNRDTSLKSHASSRSSNSRRSSKTASTESSLTSTMRDVVVNRKQHRGRGSITSKFRHVANGLDEDDQFPRRR